MRARAALAALLLPTAVAAGSAHAQHAVVLSGGGGRGLAHAGVLQALDERGHSPSIVVGTSMGAIVGALYAAGYPADSIAALLGREDWRAVFAPDAFTLGSDRFAVRPLLSMGLADAELVFGGLVPDAGINRRLVELLFDAGARARGDFDRLPRRFRAIAADLQDGVVVPLATGDLARATRASMAVPGVFSPVRWSGRTLVDGGIADNVPVAQARALGATHIVASDVLNPLVRPLPRSRVAIGIRALRLLIRNATPAGPPPDVLVVPQIPDEVTEAMFAMEASPLIEAGRVAGLETIPAAAAAMPPLPAPQPLAALADTVLIEVGEPALEPLVRHAFRPVAGMPYDAQRVLRRVNALYATGMFRGIWPRVEDRAGRSTLIVRAEPVPTSVLALAAGFDDRRGPRGLLALRYRTGVLGAAETRVEVRGHDDLRAGSASLVRPLARRPDIAFAGGVHIGETDIRRFTDTRDGHTRRRGGWIGAEWNSPTGSRHVTAQWIAEDVDDDTIAHGFSHGPALRWAESPPYAPVVGVPDEVTLEARFGDVAYTRLHARAAIERRVGRISGALVADLGVTDDDAPADARFALGDRGGLPWLSTGALRGTHRVIAGLDAAHRVFLDGALRLRFRMGTVGSDIDALRTAGRWRAGVELGGIWPTPLGALAVGVAAGNRGETRVTVDVGSSF